MKLFIAILFNLAIAFTLGGAAQAAFGANALITSGVIFATGFIPHSSGIMLMAAQSDVSAIANYAGQYSKKLIGQFLNELDIANDVYVARGVKTKLNMTKMTAANGYRPLNTNVESAGAPGRTFSGRVLEVHGGMKIFHIIPEELRKTWMGDMLSPNAKELPFAQWVWQQEFNKLVSEVNDNIYLSEYHADAASWDALEIYEAGDYVNFEEDIYVCLDTTEAGESPTTEPTLWSKQNELVTCTGLGTIIANAITDDDIDPVVTGSISSTNAYDKMKEVYRSLPVSVRRRKTVMYISHDVYEKYCDDIEVDFEKGNVIDRNESDKPVNAQYLKGSSKKCKIIPATWMNDSQRIICTMPDNLVMGTDLLSDFNSIGKKVDTLHGFKAICKFLIGFQIADLEVLAVNDQA